MKAFVTKLDEMVRKVQAKLAGLSLTIFTKYTMTRTDKTLLPHPYTHLFAFSCRITVHLSVVLNKAFCQKYAQPGYFVAFCQLIVILNLLCLLSYTQRKRLKYLESTRAQSWISVCVWRYIQLRLNTLKRTHSCCYLLLWYRCNLEKQDHIW